MATLTILYYWICNHLVKVSTPMEEKEGEGKNLNKENSRQIFITELKHRNGTHIHSHAMKWILWTGREGRSLVMWKMRIDLGYNQVTSEKTQTIQVLGLRWGIWQTKKWNRVAIRLLGCCWISKKQSCSHHNNERHQFLFCGSCLLRRYWEVDPWILEQYLLSCQSREQICLYLFLSWTLLNFGPWSAWR